MPKAKKTSLKASLNAHLARAEKARREVEGQQKAYTRKTGGKAKGKKRDSDRPFLKRDTVPYADGDKILLLGEGNFSFALSLLLPSPSTSRAHLTLAFNITATAYDSRSQCFEKYPDAESNVKQLEALGVAVLFGVDARKLEKCKELKGKKFDRVVWNFPHAGAGITDQDRNILTNQTLILEFLRSVPPLLSTSPSASGSTSVYEEGGDPPSADERPTDVDVPRKKSKSKTSKDVTRPDRGSVLITLRDTPPYTLWDVPKLFKSPPPLPVTSSTQQRQPRYTLLRSFAFRPEVYPGYAHRRTAGWVEGEDDLLEKADKEKGAAEKRGDARKNAGEENRALGKLDGRVGKGGCRTWEFVLRQEQE
ncbi:hypothetical protein BOTBODRAFT_130917 [Botryobasidium botryosum FD-172 SS1]|uniref:25S rRNA (uridine-N(3))-methyltransferase BMT5-like domain-containing protein n=1 Tax=Botryobasidium botryosum (strain FD-172 SS1) TaxID=930990 RepID=A0A067MUT5_BOTB1|nr:hypothetical protein BOTBODRAFT_130917 [Botryobasidium botryosum FD-172 SS1]